LRSEILLFVRSIIRLLQWILIFAVALFVCRDVETFVALALMLVSSLAIISLTQSKAPDRKTWIAIHVGIVCAGIAAIFWTPQWSGYIVAVVFVLFVITPNLLNRLARGLVASGYTQAAAFCACLIGRFHPSRQVRFQTLLWSAQARLRSTAQIAAYRAWAAHATAEEAEALNCWISFAQGDWEGLLGQVPGARATNDLKWFEIRALGELGRVDEMIAAYASVESVLSASDLLACRLFVLAFSGRTDAVRFHLNHELRFIGPRDKAYWIFVAQAASGSHDEDARRALASYAQAADNDEAFRRRALRRLEVGLWQHRAVPSVESIATVAAIEKTLGVGKYTSESQ
jgi:hypothetical protein